jgi:hypothetical protein
MPSALLATFGGSQFSDFDTRLLQSLLNSCLIHIDPVQAFLR